ncbi:MAG: PAS domain-containing protein [Nannocystaceae bacterium]
MTDESAQALLDRFPIALSLHAIAGEFVAASDACTRVFGRAREELLAAPLTACVDPRDVERIRAEWDAAAQLGRDVTLRYRTQRPAGSVWIETEVRPRPRDERGDGAVFACASRLAPAPAEDVEAGPAAIVERESLDLARRHRDALVAMLPALVWYGRVTSDQSYDLSYVNEYLFDLTGYTREEWLGTPGFWRSIIHPEDRASTLAEAQRLMRGELTQGTPYRLRTRAGRYLWVQSSMNIERDEAGAPVRMYGLTLDITRFVEIREQNLELMQEVAEKARRILDLSAPLIPLGDALILPLIGTIDPTRTSHALSTLLEAVQRTHVRRVIIDLTGVETADAASVAALVRAAGAVHLLGARAMLTGIRAAIARTLVELDLDLADLKSYPSLAAALAAR